MMIAEQEVLFIRWPSGGGAPFSAMSFRSARLAIIGSRLMVWENL